MLFDIDGALRRARNSLHREAFHRVFAPRGHVVDEERFKRELQGFSNVSIGERIFLPNEWRRSGVQRSSARRRRSFVILVAGQIVPLPGLMALLDRADAAGIPMVAVTDAPHLDAELLLLGLGITHQFKAIVIGDVVAREKPHPLPYQEGLRFAGASAAASIAFEDSRSGVQSAAPAGIPTIGMRTTLSHADLVAAGAVASASAYDDPTLLARLAAAMTW